MNLRKLSEIKKTTAQPVYFYGCGPLLETCYDEICAMLGRKPDGLIDSSKSKIGQNILGYRCESPEILQHLRNPMVVVTVRRHIPIYQTVKELNRKAKLFHVVFGESFHKVVRISKEEILIDHISSTKIRQDFHGKRALVTGATRGIGLFIANKLAELGFNLVLCGRDRKLLNTLENSLKHFNVNIKTISSDFSTEKGLNQFLKHSEIENKPVDLIFNNAGVSKSNREILDQPLTMSDMLHTYAVNAIAPIAISEHFLRLSSPEKTVRIVFLGSNASSSLNTDYTCTKMAILKYINDANIVYDLKGSSLFLLDPGDIRTSMNPSGKLEVESIYPGVLLPLYCKKQNNFGVIHANEFSKLTLHQAMTLLFSKYKNEWVLKSLGD